METCLMIMMGLAIVTMRISVKVTSDFGLM